MKEPENTRSILFASLGTTPYEVFDYEIKGGCDFEFKKTRFSQVASICNLAKNRDLDDVVILATDAAIQTNWDADGVYNPPLDVVPFDGAGEPNYRGLKRCIEDLCNDEHFSDQLHANLGMLNTPLTIPEGASLDEMWEIFNRIQSKVKSGDKIHLDITNGYRSIPVVMLLALDFVVKIKGATLSSVSYGAAQSTNDHRAPMWDLSGFLEIREWSNAVDAFNRGDPRRFADLGRSIFKKTQVAQDVTQFAGELAKLGDCLVDCDAPGLKDAFLNSYHRLNKIQLRIGKDGSAHESVFLTVLERLKLELEKFDLEAIQSSKSRLPVSIGAINWCLRAGLHVQAIIFIREACVSVVAEASGFDQENRDARLESDKLYGRLQWRLGTGHFEMEQNDEIDQSWCKGFKNCKVLLDAEQRWIDAVPESEELKRFFKTCVKVSEARNSIAHANRGGINVQKYNEFLEVLVGWKSIVDLKSLKDQA